MSIRERFVEVWREGGAAGILLSICNRIPGMHYFVLFWLYRISFQSIPGSGERDSLLEVEITGSDAVLDELVGVNDKRERFRSRLARGIEVLVARENGKAIAYLWLDTRPTHVEERHGFEVGIESRYLYEFDSYVHPDYRGRGVLRIMHSVARDDLIARESRTHLVAAVELQNRASIRGYANAGFERYSFHCAFRLGSLRSGFVIRPFWLGGG